MSQRIVELIPTLDRGGAERQFINLCLGLSRRGHEVHAVLLTRTSDLQDELLSNNVHVHVIGKRFRLDPLAFVRLTALLGRIRPDIVHTWLFAANSYGRLAAFLSSKAMFRHTRIFANERCVDQWKTFGHGLVDRLLSVVSDGITTNSTAVKDFYSQRGLASAQWSVIPNGIDVEKLHEQAGPQLRQEIRAEFGISDEDYLIGNVARFWPQKRLKWSLWSSDVIKRIHPNTVKWLIGDGPQRQQLLRYAQLMELDSFAHFLGVRSDVSRLIRAMDVLWLTSLYEGQPNSVLEAMALGTPVVAADIPGMSDIITDGENGFLVQPKDILGFARATEFYITHPVRRAEMIENAKRTVRERFALETMIDAYERLYTSNI